METTRRNLRPLKIYLSLFLLILALAIAYPLYIKHQTRSRRHHVEMALKHLAVRMNEFYSLQGTYKEATAEMLMLTEINKIPGYQIHIVRHENDHFTLNAIPIGKQKTRDRQCDTLSLTDSEKMYITGPSTVKNCWFL